MARIVSEEEFVEVLSLKLKELKFKPKAVTGPGRSGAIASAYASHMLGVPFLAFATFCTHPLRPLLVVDTARKSGRTIKQALALYHYAKPSAIWAFDEPPRVIFWYEAKARNTIEAPDRLYRTQDTVDANYLAGYHQVDSGT